MLLDGSLAHILRCFWIVFPAGRVAAADVDMPVWESIVKEAVPCSGELVVREA